MECENKEIKVNIDDENNEINNLIVKTEDNDTDVPSQDKTCESKENNSIKKEPSLLIQFSTKKVHLVAISAFSILTLLLPILAEFNENFYYELFKIRIKEKRIEKEIKPIYDNGNSDMNKQESAKQMYRYALIPMIYYCILAPFVEEYLFRWLIFGFIKNYGQKVKMNDKLKGYLIIAFAFIFSSILFSFAHFDLKSNNLYIKIIFCRTYWDISYFIMGVVLAWIYYHYGLILITILVQMLLNIVNTLYAFNMFASDCYDSCALNSIFIIFPVYGFAILVVFILVVVLIAKMIKKCK
ncbi:hypothetical protein PIROE2DRAFT_18510 [Piromyces sp. E2]|nr:hypothetical protein PIROE2DRAFT_18510 [Piromyces sp. E2]|eukprot:OUM56747.1 hypothetical protein PIROE2DRAFT_18510 [Piromyces sp. E2]